LDYECFTKALELDRLVTMITKYRHPGTAARVAGSELTL